MQRPAAGRSTGHSAEEGNKGPNWWVKCANSLCDGEPCLLVTGQKPLQDCTHSPA